MRALVRFLRTDAHFLYQFCGILWHIVVYESYLRKKGLKRACRQVKFNCAPSEAVGEM